MSILEGLNQKMLGLLLDRIHQNWEDDAPRLTLADWIEEHTSSEQGAMLAEFIRLQHVLEQYRRAKKEKGPDPTDGNIALLRQRNRELCNKFMPPRLRPRSRAELTIFFDRGFFCHYFPFLRDWSPDQTEDAVYWLTHASVLANEALLDSVRLARLIQSPVYSRLHSFHLGTFWGSAGKLIAGFETSPMLPQLEIFRTSDTHRRVGTTVSHEYETANLSILFRIVTARCKRLRELHFWARGLTVDDLQVLAIRISV